uniref:Sam68 tyrosine-rich domain-containing protein n=1 Tax=Oncorhynchus tshawytscha TaxID=74940 RepID=A0A8C8IED9_ONCTS
MHFSNKIERIQKGGTKKETERETYLGLFTTKNIKVKERVLIPVKQYPRFNFVGKILGPQGNTINYAEPAYEGYDNYYSQQPPQADTEYYDYGHGEAQEAYEPYAQDDWEARQDKRGAYREHPYGRY